MGSGWVGGGCTSHLTPTPLCTQPTSPLPSNSLLDLELREAIAVIRSYWHGADWGLVPLAHAFNHDGVKGGGVGIVATDDSDQVILGAKTMVDYEVGDEVFISYFGKDSLTGEVLPRGSATLFFMWGFVEANPIFDDCYDVLHYAHPSHNPADVLGCIEDVGREAAKSSVAEKKEVAGMMLRELEKAVADGRWTFVKGYARALDIMIE